jgi:hypothetical protein
MRLILWCLLTSASVAQEGGSITGKISDTFGEPISGASIQAKNAATGAIYKAASKATGEYVLGGLPDGAYELSVSLATMKPHSRQDIAIRTGRPSRVDITLRDDVRLGTLGDGDRFTQRGRPAPPTGPTPQMPDGKPDLSGFWAPGSADLSEGEPPQGLTWVESVVKEPIANDLRDMPTARCLPLASSRRRWERDKLVVTVGFDDKSWFTLLRNPSPHTEMMHVVERYRRRDMGHLELQLTVEDPGRSRSRRS